MNKHQKIFLYITILILIVLVLIKLISKELGAVARGKPFGPYRSTISIEKSKKEKVWVGTYVPDSKKYYSGDKRDSFELAEIWIEKNKNDKKIYWSQAWAKYILNIYFKRLTKNDLHKFRWIPPSPPMLDVLENIEYPGGYPSRVRFLHNVIQDTIQIEIIERNPQDSLAWTTEKIIDTITFIKSK